MIQEIPLFISPELAKSIVTASSGLFTTAKLLGTHIDNYRVAQNAFLKKDSPYIADIIQNLSLITKLPVENQESPQIVMYNKGGEYKEHHDFFHPSEGYYEKAVSQGGQRTKSCIIYLNDDFEGGETKFISTGVTIKPQTGKLLVWDNLNPDGSPDYNSLHAGLPVISGTKYILVIWIREQKWVSAKASRQPA